MWLGAGEVPQLNPDGQVRLVDVRLRIVVALWGLVQDPRESLPRGTEARGRDII